MAPITVGLKCTDGSSLSIEVDDEGTILDVKKQINATYNHQIELIKLVFGGKVLDDSSTLKSLNIRNSSVLHMVISRAMGRPPAQPTQPTQPTQPSVPPPRPNTNNNFNNNNNNNVNPYPNPNNNFFPGFGLNQPMSQLSEQLRANPELMRSIMNSPYTDMLFQNPELLTQIMNNNPQFKEIYEKNPEIAQIMNNPTILNEMKELMKNPDGLNAILRGQDQMLGQIEGMEGGFAAIQRAYHDYQEPLTNAMNDMLAPPLPPTSVPSSSIGINNSPPPNPWATNTQSAPPSMGSGQNYFNPYLAMPQLGGGNPNMQQSMRYFAEHPEDFRTMMDIMQKAGMLNNVYQPYLGSNLGGGPMGGQSIGQPQYQPAVQLPPPPPMPSIDELRTRYQDQLDQVRALGFYDDDKTLRTLHQCSGNVEYAVNRLLES